PGDGPDAQHTWQTPDANIGIAGSAASPLNTPQTLTVFVHASSDELSYGPAPDGTVVSFVILSGPGGFAGSSSCTTQDGAGSCSVPTPPAHPVLTLVRASSAAPVPATPPLHDAVPILPGDGPDAQHTWQTPDANIGIAGSAASPLNTPQTLT